MRVFAIGTVGKTRPQRQQEHSKTEDLTSKITAQHMHFKTLYIS